MIFCWFIVFLGWIDSYIHHHGLFTSELYECMDTKTLPDFMARQLDKTVRLISISYCPKAVQMNWSCGLCTDGPTVNYRYVRRIQSLPFHLSGYIAIQPEEKIMVISFQGTRGIEDWFNDLTVVMTPLNWDGTVGDEQVHLGFYQSYLSIRSQVLTDGIFKLPRSEWDAIESILLVGHSLGGVMAVLAALDLKAHYKDWLDHKHVTITTLGQPRIGNHAFAKFHQTHFPNMEDVLRIVHSNDIVPHVPPTTAGYIHSMREVWSVGQTPNSSKLCSIQDPEDPTCSNSLPFYNRSFPAHLSIWNYTMGWCYN
jgi:predicted lipase